MSKTLKIIIVSVLALITLTVAVYPVISNVLGERYRSLIETSYEEALEELDETELDAAKQAALDYNEKLFRSEYNAYSREALLEAREGYAELLNLQGDGIMGYVEIPKIKVSLPVYHGTDEDALERGAGHLLGSSLPVGGENSHSILTSHSGLSTQKLFTDLNTVEKGDIFYLKVLKETLAYQVTEINVVLPEDISLLRADEGKDYCTLVTCTPYGVNSHRLLVKGERIPFEEAAEIEEAAEPVTVTGSTWVQMYARGVVYGIIGMLAAFLIVLAVGWFRRHRGKKVVSHEEQKKPDSAP